MRPEILDLAYMGGLFDGEGYIAIRADMSKTGNITYSLYAGLNMVEKEGVELFQCSFGGRIFLRQSTRPVDRPQYRWRLDTKKAYDFLCILQPFLRLKAEKIKLAIEFQLSKKSYNHRSSSEKAVEAEAFQKMKLLNRRGIYVLST